MTRYLNGDIVAPTSIGNKFLHDKYFYLLDNLVSGDFDVEDEDTDFVD